MLNQLAVQILNLDRTENTITSEQVEAPLLEDVKESEISNKLHRIPIIPSSDLHTALV